MKKIFFLILVLIFWGKISLFANANKVCCEINCGFQIIMYEWREVNLCSGVEPPCTLGPATPDKCPPLPPTPSTSTSPTPPPPGGTGIKPGTVTVTWEEKRVRICPPGILGTPACEYPDIQTIIQKFIDFILKVAPLTLVILLILGGFLYMLSVFKPDLISLGHRYIQWAVYGYIILLLITLVFTFIRAIFGGPKL